jgi:hypothetical protein
VSDRKLSLLVNFVGIDRMTPGMRKLVDTGRSANKELEALKKETKALNAQMGQAKALRTVSDDLKKAKAASAAAADKLKALRSQIVAGEAPTKKLVSAIRGASNSLETMQAKEKEAAQRARQLTSEMRAAGVDVARLGQHERTLGQNMEGANRRIEEQRRLLDQTREAQRRAYAVRAQAENIRNRGAEHREAGGRAVMGGIAMAAPLALAAKQAITFEAAMADVRKVVDFPTPQAFARMSDDVLTLSTKIPMAAEGIAQIVAAAGRANVPRQELLRFAGDAAKMGVAFDMTGDEAGEMMAKWRTAFNLSQTGVVSLADQVNALTNAYGGNATSVSNIVTRIGALGKVAGVSASQVAAMGQLLNSVGVEEEIAATGIKNMMLAMTAGASATKSQQQAFKALGLDAGNVSKRMQTDSAGAINDVLARVVRMPKAAQAGLLTELFGSESVAAIAPMLTNLDKLQTNMRMVGDQAQYAGSMQKEYLSRIATTEGAMGLATNSLKALNIELGKQLLPAITEGSGSLVGMATSMRNFASAHPELTKFFIQAAAGGVAMRIAFGGMRFALGGLFGPLAKGWEIYSKFREAGSIAAAFPRVAAAFGMLRTAAIFLGQGFLRAGAMMLANPMVLVIVAIGVAITVLAYLVYSNWDKIKAAFGAGWQWVKDTLSAAPAWLSNVGSMMMQGLLAMIDPYGLRNRLLEVARNGVDAFKQFFGIKSPSRLMMQMGGHVADGFALGIDGKGKNAAQAARRMATGVAAASTLALSPASASAAGAAGQSAAPVTIIVHVHGAPGMNTDELADKVIRKIEDAQGITARSRYDTEGR